MVKLEYVSDYGLSLGKTFHFRVDRDKCINIDTEADNSIKRVWFKERSDVVSYFSTEGLVYVENLTTGIYLDLNKIREYDSMFKEEEA